MKNGALFYQEQVPSETLFYSVMGEQKSGILETVVNKVNETKILQFGGDETIGLGYCSIKFL